MIHIYTDASFDMNMTDKYMAGICYYIVHLDEQYNEVLFQEFNVCYFTKKETLQLKNDIFANLDGEIYTNSVMVEYLAIFKALERVKPFNDRSYYSYRFKRLKKRYM